MLYSYTDCAIVPEPAKKSSTIEFELKYVAELIKYLIFLIINGRL